MPLDFRQGWLTDIGAVPADPSRAGISAIMVPDTIRSFGVSSAGQVAVRRIPAGPIDDAGTDAGPVHPGPGTSGQQEGRSRNGQSGPYGPDCPCKYGVLPRVAVYNRRHRSGSARLQGGEPRPGHQTRAANTRRAPSTSRAMPARTRRGGSTLAKVQSTAWRTRRRMGSARSPRARLAASIAIRGAT